MTERTKGERIVRTEFNPGADDNVSIITQHAALFVDMVDRIADLDPRLATIAVTKIEEAAMWAVKLATAKKD